MVHIFQKRGPELYFPEVRDTSSTWALGSAGEPGGRGRPHRAAKMAYANNIPKFLRFLENRRLEVFVIY